MNTDQGPDFLGGQLPDRLISNTPESIKDSEEGKPLWQQVLQQAGMSDKHERKNQKARMMFYIFSFLTLFAGVFCIALAIGMFVGFNEERVETILKKVNQNPSFSVMHGFYMDKNNPKESGFRMIRVDKEGFLVLPLGLTPEKP